VLVEGTVLAQSQEASALGVSPFGTGAATGDVERIRDTLIENRIRVATQATSDWQYKAQAMKQLESTIGEPSDSGLQTDLDNFWNSWSKVATSPRDLPTRSALLEDTTALCQRIQYEYSQMKSMADDLNIAVADRVDQVNQIAEEMARLNTEIGALDSGQVPVNDLANRRDALVTELSKLASISQHGDGKESFIISIGGRVLVQGSKFNTLKCEIVAGGNRVVEWASDGQLLLNTGGEIKAITDLRDQTIPSYLSQLDFVASKLAERVNAVHRTGKTLTGADGGDFFRAGTTAANVSLDSGILDRPDLIAASASGAKGDGDAATAIWRVKNEQITDGLTINELYRQLVGDIGGSAAIADRQASAHRLSLDQFTQQMQSISGVSLDEEMTNMVKFQQAYNASARMITIMDEMLGVLIQQTGMVGR